MKDMELINAALGAAERAYAPYSGFFVGAALLCKSGAVYTGCNVENSSYGAACCAERTALFKAVSEGEREFAAIAIVGGKGGKVRAFCPPCKRGKNARRTRVARCGETARRRAFDLFCG